MPQLYAFASGFTAINIVKDDNGALYVVGITDTSGNQQWEIAVLKSTDGGSSWTEQDSANRPAYADLTSGLAFACPRVSSGKNRIAVVQAQIILESNLFHVEHRLAVFNMSSYTADPDGWQSPEYVWDEYFDWDLSSQCESTHLFAVVKDDDEIVVTYADSWISPGSVVYPGAYYAKLVNNTLTVRQLLKGATNFNTEDVYPGGQIAANDVLATYGTYGGYGKIIYDNYTLSSEASSVYVQYYSRTPDSFLDTGDLRYFAHQTILATDGLLFARYYRVTSGVTYTIKISTGLISTTEETSLAGTTSPESLGLFYENSTGHILSLVADPTDSSSRLYLLERSGTSWNALQMAAGGYDFTGDHYPPFTTVQASDGSYLFVRGPDNARVLWKVYPITAVTPAASAFGLATSPPTVIAVSFVSYPSADSSLDGWRAQNGDTTNIYEYIDEAEPADADFILNDIDSVDNCIYRCKLASLSTPGDLNDWYLSTKVWRGTGEPIPTPSIKVRLLQSTTTIAEFTHTDLPTGATRFDDQPSPAQLGNITDWSDLYLELEAYYP